FEIVAFVELEFPHVLSHGIAPGATTRAIMDVVIILALIDDGAGPFVIFAAIFLTPGGSLDRRFLAYQMVNGQSLQCGGAELNGARSNRIRRTGFDCSTPGRNTVVNKIGEVRDRIGGRRKMNPS